MPLDAAILFAPVGDLVPVALAALDQGGTLAVAGIHLSDIPALDYQAHLFRERTLTSVTANTRARRRGVAAPRRCDRHPGQGDDLPVLGADTALDDVAAGALTGAAVLLGPEAFGHARA